MSGAAPELPVGLAERYAALRVIGRGGMGVVLEALDRRLKRTVALKLIAVQDDASTLIKAFFAREARALATLSHPGVVRIFDGDVAGDIPYLVMELLDGHTLQEVVAGELPSPAQLADWLDALLDALTCIHGRGMLHRDIKPSNIFLDRTGRPVLIDFGLVSSHDATRLTVTGQVLGTPRFLAPELIRGGAPAPSTDLFALAMTAVEALSGRSPHLVPGRPISIEQLLTSLQSGSYLGTARQLAGPGPLTDVLMRALAPDPRKRFADARAMRDALAAAVTTGPRTGGEVPGPHATPAPGRSERAGRAGRGTPGARTGRPSARLVLPGALLLGGAAALISTLVPRAPAETPVTEASARLSLPVGQSAAPPSILPPARAAALRERLDEAILPVLEGLQPELEGFRAWQQAEQLSIGALHLHTREARRLYIARRRRTGRAAALDAVTRDIVRALDTVRAPVREFFAADQPPEAAITTAWRLGELREYAVLLDVLGAHAAAQLTRSWLDGQPDTLASEYLRAQTHRFERDHVRRLSHLERALERLSARRARHGPALEDAEAAGTLTLEVLDALRQQPTTGRPAVLAALARWTTWRDAFPAHPHLQEQDHKIAAMGAGLAPPTASPTW